jgi:hypothetical protein
MIPFPTGLGIQLLCRGGNVIIPYCSGNEIDFVGC